MSSTPRSLLDARDYLAKRTGLSTASLGIVGDGAHRTGYHLGKDRIYSSSGAGGDDYSVSESSRDRTGLSDYASALDIGNFNRGGHSLRSLSLWLVDQCRRGTGDTKDIREVIYTPDGRTVKRWDRLHIRNSGDDSHLFHTHISYFRDSRSRDKTGLFRRYFEGDDMPSAEQVAAEVWRYRNEKITDRDAYSHLRGNDMDRKLMSGQATQTALLKQLLANQSGLTEADIAAAVEAGVSAAMPDVAELAQAVADAVDHELDTAAVEAALRTVLGSVDETA